MPQYTFTVSQEHHKQRLDVYLTEQLQKEIPSRSFLKKLIDQKKVVVNGEPVRANYKIQKGDRIDVSFDEEDMPDTRLVPEEIDFDVFYEDEDLIVINKPVGLTVHPGTSHYRGTLVNGLIYRFQNLSDVNGHLRPGIVHRLDRDTSGLLLVAKNNTVHVRLARQFEKHKMYKKYIALVEGNIQFNEGRVDAPIGFHPQFHDMRCIAPHGEGKESVTEYKVIKRFDKKTLVALYLKTGRTHQLRVHMTHLGHPILGDDKYGRKESFSRLALHAQELGFIHPRTKEWVEFVSQVPIEFRLENQAD